MVGTDIDISVRIYDEKRRDLNVCFDTFGVIYWKVTVFLSMCFLIISLHFCPSWWFLTLSFSVALCAVDHLGIWPQRENVRSHQLPNEKHPWSAVSRKRRWVSQGDRYVWEEDPCREPGASLIWRQVLFWWVHKQFTGSLEVVHFTRLFKDLWHLRRASEANNPTFRMWVFPQRSIPDRNIK